MNNHSIIIFGAGGHAISVADVAISNGFRPIMFVSPNTTTTTSIHGVPIVKNLESLESKTQHFFAIAVGDNFLRMNIYEESKKNFPDVDFPTLIHPDASVGNWCSIGEGSVIFAGGRVGPNCTLGKFSILNTNASLDHDSRMGEFSSIAPGVAAGGNVSIGDLSAIGIGAVIKHGVSIGDNSVVGSMSNVLKNFDNQLLIFGNPAEIKGQRKIGDSYL